MSLPMIGAHAAILGVAAFEGNVRSILINLDQLANRTGRMAASQQRDFDSGAKAAEVSQQQISRALEAQTRAYDSAAKAQVAIEQAKTSRLLAEQAKVQAAIEQQAAFELKQQINATPGSGPIKQAMRQGPLANANLAAAVATSEANELERVARANERAADSASAYAARQAQAAATASASLVSLGNTAAAVAAKMEAAEIAKTRAAEAAAAAQVAIQRASEERQLASAAKAIAAQAAAAASTLNAANPRSMNMLGAGGKALPSESAALAANAATNAAALEKQAAASEKAAVAAMALARNEEQAAQAALAVANAAGQITPELNTATAAFSSFGAIGTAAMFAIVAAITLTIAAIVGFGVASIKAGADYAQAMNTTQALTEATNAKMSELDGTIREIGTHTLSGMTDAAKAATELAKGGVDVDTAMQGALKSVVNLAAASVGELSLAEAAKAVANGVAAFNLQGSESVKVADSLAGVAQSTTASFGDLAHSLSQVGTVANSLGFSIFDTTDAIGLLALSAIKGSDAGTSLRAMFQQLEKPTKAARQVMNDFNVSLYDSTGAARPLRDIIDNLETAFGKQAVAAGKLTQEQRDLALATLFGRDGQRAALALINQGVEGYAKLAEAQHNLTAEDLAGKMLVPLNAQLAILGNNINAAQIAIGGSFEPALQKAAGAAISWLQGLNADTSALTVFGNIISSLATGSGLDGLYTQLVNVFGPNTGNMIIEVVNLFRNVGDAIATYIAPALSNLGETIGKAFPTTDLDTFAGAMGNAAEAVRIIAADFAIMINMVAKAIEIFNGLPDPIKLFGVVGLAAISPLNTVIAVALGLFLLMPAAVNTAIDALIALPPITQLITQAFEALGTFISDSWSSLWKWVGDTASEMLTWIGDLVSRFGSFMGNTFAAIMTAVVSVWAGGWTNAGTVLGNFMGIVGQLLSKLFGAMGTAFGNAGAALGRLWQQIWQGLVNIAASGITGLLDKINTLLDALRASSIGEYIAPIILNIQTITRSEVAGMDALSSAIDTTQENFQAFLTDVKQGLQDIKSPFEGINFSAGGAPAAGRLPTSRTPVAGEGSQPSPPDVGGKPGGGGKSAAEKAADEAQKRLEEIYQDTSRQLQNITEDTLQKIADIWSKYNDNIVEANRESADKIIEIARKRNEDLALAEEAFHEGKEREVIKRALNDQIEDNRRARDRIYEDNDRAQGRLLEDIRRARQDERELKQQAYDYEIDDKNRADKRALEAQETALKRSNQAVADALSEQQQMQSRALSQMFEAQNAARQSQYSDEDAARANARAQASASRGYARSLAGAKTPEERASAQASYQQQLQDLAISQSEAAQDRALAKARKAQEDAIKLQQQASEDALKKSQQYAQKGLGYSQEDSDTKRKHDQEDKDVLRQRAQAKAAKDFKRGLDDEERKTTQDEEDKQVLAKRARDDVERGLKKQEDQIVRDLEAQWAQEDYDKKITKINATADADIAKQEETLATKLRKLDAALLLDLQHVEENFDKQKRALIQKWEDAWDELIAKSPGIKGELNALFADFSANVSATDDLIKNMIQDLKDAIALNQQLANGQAPATTPTSIPSSPEDTTDTPTLTSIPNSNQPPPSVPGLGFASGGIVPGPMGAPKWVVAHGGEPYLGMQNAYLAKYLPLLTQIAAINSRAYTYTPPSVGAQTTNISYNVDANYSQYQSAASVSMDMQALATMTRR